MANGGRVAALVLGSVLAAGCPSGSTGDTSPDDKGVDSDDTSPDGVTDTDTDTDTVPETANTGDTGTTLVPSTLTASCSPTNNALRFVCTVAVDPPQAVQIRFGRADGTGAERIHASAEAVADHEVPLYLMAPDTEYSWTAETLLPGDTVVTGSVTTGIPESEARTTLDLDGTSSVPYVGTHQPCNDEAIAVIYDTATGELVWYEELDPNGTLGFFDMIRFTEDHTVLGETGPSIVEVDLAGEDIVRFERDVDYTGFLHHDLVKKDGLIWALFQDPGDPTLDGFKVFDTQGQIAEWYARDTLDIPRDAFGDWMHTNTIWVEDDKEVLLSSWGQDTVIKVQGDWTLPDFGAQLWAMDGDGGGGLGDDFTIDWSYVPDVDGFRDQHDVHWMSDGRMVMLDNAHGRGLVLTVDEVAHTATADVSFDAGPSTCGPQGTATEGAGGNVLVACSGNDLFEYAPTGGDPVWQATALCPGGDTSSVIRWYALDGW